MVAFKAMAYNLMNGLHGKKKGRPTELDPCRLDAAREVIKEESPDIAFLSEAFFCDLEKYPQGMDYKQLFDYPYGFGTCYEKYNGHMILSRHPFKEQEALPVGHSFLSPLEKRSLLWAQVGLGSKVLSLVGAYPAHGRESEKKKDWESAFSYDRIRNAEHLIVAGDLNVFSDQDHYHRNLLAFCCRFIRSHVREFEGRSSADVVDDFLSRQAIPYLRSQGLKDTYTPNGERWDTMPTDAIVENKWLKPFIANRLLKSFFDVRVDYILARDIEVKKAYIVRNKHTEIVSDHYPVVTVFDV